MKPFRPPTAPATRAIIGLCAAVQIALSLGGEPFADRVAFGFGLIPARLTGAAAPLGPAAPAWATPFTALFVHAGWAHLLMNMVVLAWVGRMVEWAVRPRRLLLLFAAGGVAGNLLQVAVAPQSQVPVVGASGGIAAVFAAYAVLFARNGVAERTVAGIRVAPELLTALWYAAAWIGVQLLTALALNGPGGGWNIAIWAHIGGFLAGLAFAHGWRARTPALTR